MIVYDPSVWMQAFTTARNSYEQIAKLEKQLDALKGLDPSQYQWSDAQAKINELGRIIQQNNALAYNAQNLDEQFKKLYPGYVTSHNYSEHYQKITATTLNTLNQVLQSIGANAQDFENESSRLDFLQRQASSAKGQTQAIQAAAQIASEQVTQTQLLRQTVMAQSNAQTAYYAAETQKEAAMEANMQKIFSNNNTDLAQDGAGHTIWTPK